MKIKVDTAIATQITQEMFDDESVELPKRCHRLKGQLYGYSFDDVTIWFIPFKVEDRRKLCAGDWVIDSIFSTRVLTDDEFRSYAFDMGLKW